VDNDIFWHIKTGEYILKHKIVPQYDVFSYTIEGRPWLNNQWLAEVIFYIVYSFFNLNGVILFKATIICLTFLIALFVSFRRNEYSWLYILIATLAVIASSGRFIERPENFSLFFIAVYLCVFTRHKGLLWLIPIIQIFWVNMHGGFIIGLLLAALFVAGEAIEANFRNWRPWPSLMLLIAVFLACFINPFGPGLVINTFQFVENKLLQKNILEWLPPFLNLGISRTDTVFVFALLIVISAVSLILSFRKMKPFLVLCLAIFLYLGLSARRNMTLFAIFSVVFIGIAITQIVANLPLRLQKIVLRSKAIISVCLIFLLCVLICLVVTNRYYLHFEIPQDFGLGVSTALQPIGAGDFIKENKIKGKLFNDYDFGSYLIYALYPQQKVFIDGRIDTYGAQFFRNEYGAFFSNNKEIFWRYVNKYGIDIFVLKMGDRNPVMSYLLEEGNYRMVYFDRASVIILKNSPLNKELIARYAIDTTDAQGLERRAAGLKVWPSGSWGMVSLSRILDGLVGNRRFPIAEYELGIFFSELGAFELSRRQFEKGIAMSPAYKIIRYELGNLYFRSGRLDEAMEAYSQVLKFDQRDYKVFKVLGDICLAKNDFLSAASLYEKSIRIKPSYDVSVYKTLGKIYEFYLNDKEKAQGFYQRYDRLARPKN
jgi:tetratricopeptide (TPR) repeat protein